MKAAQAGPQSHFDELEWQLAEWLKQLEKEGDRAAEVRSRRMGIGEFALSLFWGAGWAASAARDHIAWGWGLAALPWLIFVWGIIHSDGPAARDDYVQRRLADLRRWMEKRANAVDDADAENAARYATLEAKIKHEIEDYFRTGIAT